MSECEGQSDKRLTTIVEEQRSTRLGSNNIANMTGKRPRGLTRTKSVSQLGSGATLEQEFSPLLENPKERLKPTIMEPEASPFSSPAPSPSPLCAPRVVIGFNPKPLAAHGLTIHSECAASTPSSAPCSPSFQSEKATSPRSALNSLFSRQRAQVSDGVGLGIVLRAPVVSALASEAVIKAGADHIAILVRDDDIDTQRSHVAHHVPVEQSRRHSHPIPTPGISPCHFTRPAPAMDNKQVIKSVSVRKGPHQVARPVPGWLQQDTRRDTFMLAPSVPVKSFIEETVAAALTASSHFLDECSFCKRHLPKDKDIFMYRGDKAFCSVECRSQQMLLDERTKHCSSSALHRRSFASPVSFVAAA